MNQEITVRMKNVQAVRDYFISHKSGVKSEIAKETSLSQASVTTILQELMSNQFIDYVDDCQSTGGRKAKRYELRGDFTFFGLVQLQVESNETILNVQVRNIAGDVIDASEKVVKKLTMPALEKIVKSLVEKFKIEYLSISFPGIIDHGKVTKSDIPAFTNIDLKAKLSALFPLQIVIENDVNTAMLGYVHDRAVEEHSIAFVYQPDNHHSGCGLYVNGQVVYGATHFAGELAYLPNGNLEDQVKALTEHPAKLLVEQVQTLIATINPSQMVLKTFSLDEQTLKEMLMDRLPAEHWPAFIFVEDMSEYIYAGLFALCLEQARYR